MPDKGEAPLSLGGQGRDVPTEHEKIIAYRSLAVMVLAAWCLVVLWETGVLP